MEECRESKGTADCIKTVTVLKMVNIVILSEAKDLRLFTTFRVTKNMDWQFSHSLTVPMSRSGCHGEGVMGTVLCHHEDTPYLQGMGTHLFQPWHSD